mmetsp:Transcript_1272/g.1529  ORF Transcript_1272/g.1529 Transcript_1272/m.1529 type:complete len:365 (+) Transcript_1272:120-1214(+)
MTSTHTADAAGGEAIYSSDGLSPLPIPPPPSSLPTNRNKQRNSQQGSSSSQGDDDDGDALILDTTSNDVVRAFEVFSGKVFGPSTSTSCQKQERGNESRLERLARIQAELEEMEEDYGNADSNNDELGDEEIMGVIKDLSDRLQVLQNGTDVAKRQTDLTSMVNNLSLQSTKEDKGPGQSQGSLTLSHQQQGGLTQEQRLLRIENALGSQFNTGNISAGVSILQRLKEAEDKLNSIDEQSLNQAASRAKVIRADLEAAAKARSKINNTNVEDAAKIAKLHNQLVDMDGFLSSNILSTVVHRLSTCASLHSQSMEFGRDLRALEGMVKDTEVTLVSVEDSVNAMESGLIENMKVIQKNMERLDKS